MHLHHSTEQQQEGAWTVLSFGAPISSLLSPLDSCLYLGQILYIFAQASVAGDLLRLLTDSFLPQPKAKVFCFKESYLPHQLLCSLWCSLNQKTFPYLDCLISLCQSFQEMLCFLPFLFFITVMFECVTEKYLSKYICIIE